MTAIEAVQITEERTAPRRSPAWKRWLSVQAYGIVTRTLFPANASPQKMRTRFERFADTPRDKLQQKYPNLSFDDHGFGNRTMESIRAVNAPSSVLMHLHGGAYFMGTPASYRSRSMRLSYRCDAEVFVPDYRLAPEHPAPAALEDALEAWCELKRLRPDRPMFLSGDSAGGGLAIALMAALRDSRLPLPDGAILFSPWTDLSAAGASIENNHGRDVWLSRAHCEAWAAHYLGHMDPRDPRVSPLYGTMEGLPPMLLLVGEREVLLDDARRVHEKASGAGVRSILHVGRSMQHDWPLTLPWLEESREAWAVIAEFVAMTRSDRAPLPRRGTQRR